jgi:hypothetical protein
MTNAIPVVELTGSTLGVNHDNMGVIVSKMEAARVDHVSIVSVTGSFRTGKSFLLSLMAEYLAHHEDPSAPLTTDSSWIGSGGHADPAFRWRAGVDRHTTGIWMLPMVFVRENKGKRVGILLMDTQGLWDGDTAYSTLSSIFGLSSVMSSLQIYNLMRNIELDKLDQLRWFAGFGAGAMRARGEDIAAFQSLHILVRDWVGFSDVRDLAKCKEQTQLFLSTQRKHGELSKFLEGVEQLYTQVGAFPLPPPGERCCFDATFTGDLGEVDPAFVQLLTLYFADVFAKPVVKQINGSPMAPRAFGALVSRFAEVFASDDIPGPLSFAGAMEDVVSCCAREAAVNRYRDGIMESIERGAGLLPGELEAEEDEWRGRALALFDRGAIYGDEGGVRKHRRQLVASMDDVFSDLVYRNTSLRTRGLDAYAPCLVACVGAIVTDKVSDLSCDWWLPACVEASAILFRVYVYGFLALAGIVGGYYYRHGGGSTAAASVSMASRAVDLCRARVSAAVRAHGGRKNNRNNSNNRTNRNRPAFQVDEL